MNDLAQQLTGRSRWLLWPLAYGNTAGAACASLYLVFAVHAPDVGVGRLAALVVLPLGLVLGAWALLAQGRVRTVRHLASGRIPLADDHLLTAVREARAVPDWLFTSTLLIWVVGCGALALASSAFGHLDEPSQLRVASLMLTCGPIAAVLTYLLAVRRARALVELITAQVPKKLVLQALQAEKRRTVGMRLIVFTVVLVVGPAALVADLSREAAADVLEKVARAPKASRAAIAADASRAGAARVLALAALLAAVAIGAAALGGKNLGDPMRHVADEALRLTHGDLRDVRLVAAEDEVWVITSTFTLMQAQLHEIVEKLHQAGISIGTTTEQLMATSSKYESGAADQATSLNETSATTEELAQSARQISHNASNVAELAQKTLDAARAGQDSAAAFVSAVERMKHDNHSIAEAVTRLQRRVQQIGRIVEFITTVADRSDLLALSAELEGTKAGEVGRGFTLVAAEMRRLAENVIESTNEIEELIGEIREATSATVGATDRGMQHTASGTELAGAVSSSLQAVVGLAQNTADSVRAISLATQQQQSSTDQLAEAMADILGITQQSLAATRQVTTANQELIGLSTDLKSLVEAFKA